jgi:hypothetical protein
MLPFRACRLVLDLESVGSMSEQFPGLLTLVHMYIEL